MNDYEDLASFFSLFL